MRADCRKRMTPILGRPMMREEEAAIDRRMRRAVKELKRTDPTWGGLNKAQRLDKAAELAGTSFERELSQYRMEVPPKAPPLPEDVRQAERDRQQRAEDLGWTIRAVRGVRFVRRQGNPEDAELTGSRWFTDQPSTSNTYTGDFGKDMATASMKVRLRLRNPLVIDAKNKRFDGIPREWLPEAVQKEAIRGKLLSTDDIADAARIAEGGYDGVIFKNLKDDLTSNAITTKPATVYVVFDRKNIRSEFAQFDPEWSEMPGLLFQSAAPTYYSALTNWASSVPQPKAPAAQWKAMLAKAPGIKAEEIEWTGVNDWLDAQEGSVTREDLVAFLEQNGVKVEEVVKGASNPAADRDLQRELLPLIERRDALRREYSQLWEATQDVEPGSNEATDAIDRGKEIDAEIDDLSRQIDEIEMWMESDTADTQWSTWTLPGGENYREMLLTLPAPTETARYKELSDRARKIATMRLGDVTEDGRTVSEVRDEIYAEQEAMKEQSYTSSHWSEPNVLAHVRFKERVTADGQRTLALEEIQSDWHQAGRKQGYAEATKLKQLKDRVDATKAAQSLAEQELIAAISDPSVVAIVRNSGSTSNERETLQMVLDGIRVSPANLRMLAVNNFRNPKLDQSVRDRLKAAIEAAEKANSAAVEARMERDNFTRSAVPNAPFKNNAWANLVLKRMVRWAAENGFDSVSWIPGNIQNGQEVDAEDGRSDFYDKIIPNLANKLGKKYGTKVEIANVGINGKNFEAVNVGSAGWQVFQEGEPVTEAGMTEQEARAYVAREFIAFHSLPITEEMRQDALERGFTLFQTDYGAMLDLAHENPTDRSIARMRGKLRQMGEPGIIRLVKEENGKVHAFPGWSFTHADYMDSMGINAAKAQRGIMELGDTKVSDVEWVDASGAPVTEAAFGGRGSQAYEDAKAKGLDMSTEARKARAEQAQRAAGTPDDLILTPLYHGTTADITEFQPSTEGALGPGVYLGDAEIASEFADDGTGEGGNVIPVYVFGRILDVSDENPGPFAGTSMIDANGESLSDVVAKLQADGYAGVRNTSNGYVNIFDPANIRSVNAAFDPEATGANILNQSWQGDRVGGFNDDLQRGDEAFYDERLSATQNKMVEMARNGFSNMEIAEEMDTTENTVAARLYDARQKGIDVPKVAPGTVKGADRIRIEDLIRQGFSNKVIAERLGKTFNHIGQVRFQMKKAGRLFQDQKRASVQIAGVMEGEPGSGILSDKDVIVRLTKAADKTSFLHESAHIFLELYGALESENEAVAERMAEIRKVLKLQPGESLTRDQHEKFAELFEAYLMEGKAPSAELRSVFQKFRAWFTEIYRRLRGRLPNLNQEARDIFDRMLATEDEIEFARSETTLRYSERMAGMMTQEQVAKYKRYADQAGQVAQDKLFRKHMDQVLKRQRAQYRADKARIEAGVREQIGQLGVYRARADLTDDGRTLRAGVNPDMVATDYGYTTGDALVKAMARFPSLDRAVERETKRQLDDLYGDLLTDGSAEAEALAAVFNEPSIRALEAERDALAQQAAKQGIPLNTIRARAEQAINSTRIDQIITPGKYAIKARDLHKRAIRAAAQGKWDDALRYTHQAMYQHELARRAFKAREEFETIRRVLKPYRGPKFPKKDTHKKMDPAFIRAIRDVMSLPGDDNQFDRMESLRRFQAEQAAEGIPVSLPDAVIANTPLPDYRAMTMDQLRDFRDSVKALAKQGRDNSAEARAAFTADVESLAQVIRDNYTGKAKRETRNPTWMEKAGHNLRELESLFLRYPFLVEALQGGKQGPVVEALEQGLRRQLTARNERRNEMGRKLVEILDKHKITQDELNRRMEAPAIEDGPVKFEQVLALALNMGTESNRNRVANDPSLGGMAALEALLADKMEKRHWDAVQDIWDMIDTLWPEAKAVEQRVTGMTPKKVDALPLQTKHGTYRGGYYPIAYDRAFLSNKDLEKSDVKDLWKGAVNGMATHAATNKGFLQERQESVSRPLSLNLDTILSHIDDVTNDIYMREETIKISRILRHPAFMEALAETHGREYARTLETVVKRVVHGTERADGGYEKLWRTLRVNASVAILGGNVRTALLAPVSYFQTVLPRYGPKVVLDGMMSFYSKGFHAQKFITEKSAFMRERFDTLSREAHERVRNAKRQSMWNKAQGASYWLMSFVEIWSTSGPTWMGVYNDAKANGKSEADAITDADRAVATTQGSGLEIDQSVMQGGSEFDRALTFMWGYVSGYYGVVRNDIAKAPGYKKAWPIVKHLVLLNIAASMMEAFLRMVSGGDDEDPYLEAMLKMYWRNLFGMVPGVSLAANRYGSDAPAVSAGKGLFDSWRMWEKAAGDYAETGEIEGDVAYKATRKTLTALGVALGVPGTVQIDKIINTLVVDDDPTAYEIFISGPDDEN